MDKDNEKIINIIKEKTGNSGDITYRKMLLNFQKRIDIIYAESVSDANIINEFILKNISHDIKNKKSLLFKNILDFFSNTIPTSNLKIIDSLDNLYFHLFNGFTIILIDNSTKAIAIETRKKLDRGIQVAETESIITGPKDAFTENYITNIGLIRKRIKSEELWIEEKFVGKQTHTKVGIIYMKNIAQDRIIDRIREKIDKIDIDGIIDSGYIKELIADDSRSFFPTIKSTERPDLVAMTLLKGKVCIVVENSPLVLVLPAFFIDFFHYTEDYYQKTAGVLFIRIVRILAFLITVLGPGLFLAVTTYNQEILPTEFLLNFAQQREGVPFPSFFEMLIMGITFEILREADTRIPKSVGSAISVVGALVLGDAAVTAGIVSPIMVIVVAAASISGLLFQSSDMINGIAIWRLIMMIGGGIAGIYGIFITSMILLIHLCSITCFDIPFLKPLTPFDINGTKDAINRASFTKALKREKFLAPKNMTKQRRMSND